MEKWLEFRVENEECKHEQDQYNGCPLCEIDEKDALLEERAKAVDNCLIQIDELVDMLENMIYNANAAPSLSNALKAILHHKDAVDLLRKYRGK
jgi:hypothetical protein